MKINKDNIIGAVVMLVITAVVLWGVLITKKVNQIAAAHDRLVVVLDPVIQQIQKARQMAAQQQTQKLEKEPEAAKSENSSKGK